MSEVIQIPMFPLAILPLPGELVPLHIFEPRYRQLLQDLEMNDINFGIYFSHEINNKKVGSLMRLESVIKRYPSGESDIIVKCEDVFTLDMLLRNYKSKMYPGGDVHLWDVDNNNYTAQPIYEKFLAYLKLRNINEHVAPFNVYQIANELSLDLHDRYRFLLMSEEKRETFLMNRIKFLTHLLQQEDKSKDFFHLN